MLDQHNNALPEQALIPADLGPTFHRDQPSASRVFEAGLYTSAAHGALLGEYTRLNRQSQ